MMREEFGEVTQFPALFGRQKMCITFDVENSEKLFRSEGQYPHRRGFETLEFYRKTVRPDIYNEYGSLATE
jgi:cytochrome P450 family 12